MLDGAVQAGIQHVAAIDFEGVVFDAAAIHAVLHAAHHAHLGFVLPGLIADAGRERDELREITAVESDRHHFFLRDRAGDGGGLGLHLPDIAGFHVDFFGFRLSWHQRSVER